MTNVSGEIYKDIGERTGGDVYIGVVGPVRAGKSTFIKKFMETAVIPNITGEHDKQRAVDELPQSAGGKTVMTAEPKFVPNEAVEITAGDSTRLSVRMIDSVGYLIPGALGETENGETRLVVTPWHDDPVPFAEAAEDGTRRVIRDHSTIGILVTADGSFGDFGREAYVDAEERIAAELKELGKPFAVVLNSAAPGSDEAVDLAMELEKKYDAPVALLNCLDLNGEDVDGVLGLVLSEFPLRELTFRLPVWTGVLDRNHWLRRAVVEGVTEACAGYKRAADAAEICKKTADGVSGRISTLSGADSSVTSRLVVTDMAKGSCEIEICLPQSMFYSVIGELTGIEMESDADLLRILRSLSEMKREYDKFAKAIDDVTEKGYGIVMPEQEDLTLDGPEIVKQAGGYGLRLRATAPSIHMIRAGIEAELNPIVGTEQQSRELVEYLLKEFEGDPRGIWDTNLFGKSIYELVNEGLHSKLDNLPEDAREKFGETLARVVNEGSNGLICIIL
ncbi:MAG: stage IV sporulation protein A [Clostridia bacterium]|nr:stage IV sporulation protein A [Clostridia bacterium]